MATQIRTLPVMSLQTGETVAQVRGPLLDSKNLELVALLCEVERAQRVLMVRDIRELAMDCVIVDNEEELAEPEDVIRVQTLLAEKFMLIGLPVVTEMNRRLGTVEDYTINLQTFRLQKLYVRQSLLRSFLGSSLIIDRQQIIDVTTRHVVVHEPAVTESVLSPKPAPNIPS